jgi:hypothetical protein
MEPRIGAKHTDEETRAYMHNQGVPYTKVGNSYTQFFDAQLLHDTRSRELKGRPMSML